MTRAYRFVQVDVFTNRIFGGNQLAVFLQPDGLSDSEMQAIANEMNFAETTFVFEPTQTEAAARVRIFTPANELPFAGHPTVGTTWVLANKGLLKGDSNNLKLEEGIGLVPVKLEGDPRSPSAVWMSHRDPAFGPPLENRAEIAQALGLSEADLLPGKPVRSGSTGVTFLYVPLANPETVDRAEANMRAVAAAYPGDRLGVFIFAPDPSRGPARVYSRMFAGDTIGITEDAATGAASGPLGAYIAEQDVVALSDPIEIVSLQGNKMDRPSIIRMRLDLRDGRATNIQVGGAVVPVLEGELTLPS
jgi:trans-2,3-dihydro-3-hydroxyanthranilate isomerase